MGEATAGHEYSLPETRDRVINDCSDDAPPFIIRHPDNIFMSAIEIEI